MQIVINIPEEDYKGICQLKNEQLRMLPEEVAETLIQIANGTPLPKGHGRLIDESDLMPDSDYEDGIFYAVSIGAINGAPTIIEADTESGDKK